MAVIYRTKRVKVSQGQEQQREALLEQRPSLLVPVKSVTVRDTVGPPKLSPTEIWHIDAWREIRAQLPELQGPSVVKAFECFMAMVEDGQTHIFLSPSNAAYCIRGQLAPQQIPIAPINPAVPDAFRNGKLLVHMISGLPNEIKEGRGEDSWTRDLRLMNSETGYEVCSMTLAHGPVSIYGYPYGVFAVVPEDEVLVIGVNDLGVNKLKHELSGKGYSFEAMRKIIWERVGRTHSGEMIEHFTDYEATREEQKKTPSNEIVVNLKTRHLVGICVNVENLESTRKLTRMRGVREKDIDQIRKNVEKIQVKVQQQVGRLLSAYCYDYRMQKLTALVDFN
jgi:hypothetical protein